MDRRFNFEFDKKTGYRTKSILCMAITDERTGAVVAVLQALNKADSQIFTQEDEELMSAFAAEVSHVLKRAAHEVAYNDVTEKEGALLSLFRHNPYQKPRGEASGRSNTIKRNRSHHSASHQLQAIRTWEFNVLLEEDLLPYIIEMHVSSSIWPRYFRKFLTIVYCWLQATTLSHHLCRKGSKFFNGGRGRIQS